MNASACGRKTCMVAASVVALCAASLSAETFTVASGESLTLDASTNNKAGNQITLEADATLVAPVGSGDGYRIDANVYVAGKARIDLESTPTDAFYLRIAGGLAAKDDTCSLTIGGGRTEVFFGLQNIDRSPNADIAADGVGINYPIIDLKNLYFDATERGTFHLRASSACTVIQLPTTCNFKFNTGVTLAIKGADALAPLGQANPYSITNFNAVVLDGAAIPAGSTVKVDAGRKLAVKPCDIYDGWVWGGVEQEVNLNVELEGDDSLLLFRTVNANWTRFVGDITGEGKVYVRGENDSRMSRVLFSGDIACKGGLQTSSVADVRFGPDAGWRSRVKHWFDAADEDSYVMFAAEPPTGRTTKVGDATSGYFDTIVGWKDTLTGTNGVFCYNTRMWRGGKEPKENFVLEVLPYIVPKGLNGLNYISFGKTGGKCTVGWGLDTNSIHARRLPFWKGEADGAVKAAGAAATSECKYAIMVYGSQQGGGMALLGTTTTSAARPTRNSTLSDPWIGINAAKFSLFADGEEVDPATGKPNGGWQIVSLDMTGQKTVVDSIGAQTASGENATAAGGQNYAEVILFESAPTEAERKACERYLAKKWGLTQSYKGGSARGEYRLNSASDETAVTVVGDVKLTGVYEGALSVADHSKVSFTRALPPTEADLPTAGRVGWFDPDFEPTRKMRTTNAARPLELDGVLCRTADGVDTTRGWFGGSRTSEAANRSPWIAEGSRSGGPARHWIDFRDKYDVACGNKLHGNTLRYRTSAYSETTMANASSTSVNIQQAFMVLDTSAGGGTPLLDTVGATGVVRARRGNNKPGDSAAYPIHVRLSTRATEGVFTNGKAWLDKTQVDPYKHNFSGCPEVLTLETTGDFPAGFLGYYGGSNDGANYEVMGEVIFYSAPLSDADRAKVQDYLIYKWLGKMDGSIYSDSTAATLSGAGTVTAASIGDVTLPDLSSFTGTLALSGGLSLKVGETKTLPYALSLPAGCAISVEVPEDAADGTYTLLEAASIHGFEDAEVALVGETVEKYKANVSCADGKISVRLRRITGILLILQ